MSCQLTRPSDAALQAALHTFRQASHPPPLVPHPPEKSMAWRTRRIVAELNALKSVEALAGFEAELRGVLSSQESRCRTTVMTAALSSECVLREREALQCDEAAARVALTRMYTAVTSRQFDVIHLRMQEEMTRRALRRSERAARRDLTHRARAARLFLAERDARDALGAQEACWREELHMRRVVEIGNDIQREIIAESRLSGHLRSVAHFRSVQAARHELELREERDRAAVTRLHELSTIVLFESAKADFSAAMHKDVALLSDANREAAVQATRETCAHRLQFCQEQEAQLRLLVEEQEATQFKALAHGFLLGWRSVYKVITKDPDVFVVLSKIELLVRRDIADQERRAFGVVQLAAQCGAAVHQRHRAERRALCQGYVAGARAIWDEEGQAANALFRRHHVERGDLEALGASTVLFTAETARRRGHCGTEALARLALKTAYISSTLVVRCAEETRRLVEEEAREFRQLQHRCATHFQAQCMGRLVGAESAARMALERDESAAAADTFLRLRQSLLQHRVSDASRPLLQVEADFRARLEEEEKAAWHVTAQHCCRRVALAWGKEVEANERAARTRLKMAQVVEAECLAREALCTAAVEGLAILHIPPSLLSSSVEREADDDRRAVRVAAAASRPLDDGGLWSLPGCVVEPWSDVCAGWELDESGAASAVSFESRKISVVPLLPAYVAQCEEVLTDAYLERDVLHFAEHTAWRRLVAQAAFPSLDSTVTTSAPWRLHSISLKQEPHQRAASVNMWDSGQHFDVSFPLTQQQEEAIVGERTITFYVPYASTISAVLPRSVGDGMVFFLVLDDDGTVLSSATLVMEADGAEEACLCVALHNGAGYLRFE